MIRVVKRNGRVEKLDISKIQKFTSKAVEGLKSVSQSELEIDAKLHFYDMIPTSEIQTALIKTAVDKISLNRPDWTFVAGRLFLYDIYHKVSGFTGYIHLREYFERGEREGRILLGLKEKYDLEDLNSYIRPERDLQFTYIGIKTLYDRYLLKGRGGETIELPQHLFMGVAMFLAQNELDPQSWAKKFYDILSKFEVMAATPTLSNARTARHQLSSCFPKGERVLTSDGFRNIEDVQVDDYVVTHKGRVKRVYDVLHRDYNGELYIFKISISEAENRILQCTSEHPILTIKREEIETSSAQSQTQPVPEARWIEAESIRIGDVVKVIFHPEGLNETNGEKFTSKKSIFGKVEEIEIKSFDETVYNLEVEDDHSYVVNNIAVHNCYVGSTPDNIEGIFNAYKEMALLSKFGGGIGWDWTKVRAMGSTISGHKGAAGGIIPFLKIANDIAIAVDQLGCVAYDSFVKILNRDEDTERTTPISQVKVGDLVKSFNIELNRVEYRKVEAIHELEVKRENQIKISFKDGYIITSNWHPMAIKGKDRYFYKRSDEVEVGEYGVNHRGEAEEIVSIEKSPNISERYLDLTVDGTNNYFASTHRDDGGFYLTHNTRKGAIAVYIEPWHMDVREFIELKKNSGEERRRTHDLFTALWINDLFMKRVQEDSRWTLFDPYEVQELTELYGEEFERRYVELESDDRVEKEVISAKGLWKEILRNYFETGNPFLSFKDTANIANPNGHSGIIRSSNLCVTGDTRLSTQFGLIRADELEKMGRKIYATYDYRTDGNRDEYGVGVAECIEMYKTGESLDVYQITTKDGYEIKSTDWHDYYVVRDGAIIKTPLKDVKITDKVLIQSDVGQFGKNGYYELGVIIGFMAGERGFIKRRGDDRVADINLFDEEIVLKDLIKEFMERVAERDYLSLKDLSREDLEESGLTVRSFHHTENVKRVKISDVRVGKILTEKYGLKGDGESKSKVPELIFRGKKGCVVGYLSALFTSDSTIKRVKKGKKILNFTIQITNRSREFLKEIQILLSNFGVRSGIREVDEKRKLFRLKIDEKNVSNFINRVGLLGSKQKKVLNILRRLEGFSYSEKERGSLRWREYFEVEIESIKYVGREDVYDTTQLINHSLIFNGVVTGNCTEIFQNTSPNHYKIKVTFDDFSEKFYEEEELVQLDNGLKKPAKMITALDTIDGKSIWMVDKDGTDGDTAVCNLASINLSKVNREEDISRVVPIAVRMLDNVIDLNFYPLKKVKKSNFSNRGIGLGVMGEAQMLSEAKIYWGSDKHLNRIDEIMEAVSYYAIKTSSDLAIEKGKYPTFEGSDWSKGIFPIDKANRNACKLVDRGGIFGYKYDWELLREKVKSDGMRNGYLMAIAPTSSISILTGTTQTIEPIFKKRWYEKNLSGMIPVVAPNLSPDTWQYYISGYELDQRVLVRAAAVRQKWIDQGQSLNIFIALDRASGKYLNEIYMEAWRLGLKSTYYLRSQSPEEIKSTESVEDRSIECVGCQ